jgi:nucleoid-associated protein YgaU
MTEAVAATPEQPKVLWRHTVAEPLDATSVELIGNVTGIKMPWYFDDDEWLVGYKLLENTSAGDTFIQVVRLAEGPGVVVELVSTNPDDTTARWQGEVEGVEQTLANLGVFTYADAPDEVLLSVDDARRAAVEALHEFVSTIEDATTRFSDSSRRQGIIDAALNMADELARTQTALTQLALLDSVQQTTSEPTPELAARVYTVEPGETLWAIAERFYGDGAKYQTIADASGIADPGLIEPGQNLTLP